ncbi:MAG: UDP-N-acetylglucosamine 2-epimerase (non-hydrolyzing) [Bacteroidetes bacterium]|nr:UDP-N-acetylglucosamine 2-epimerase (non-hydrolyzing) [Bacteroidota bacterium]
MLKILTIIGARPQIIKAAALSRAIRTHFASQMKEIIVHTGQHYDASMSLVFFDELGIPKPDYNLNVGSNSHGKQTAAMLVGIEEILDIEKPNCLVVYGDTNSTLAGALAAAKVHVPVVHIEAGLRSFNKAMPEEINRIVCDHVSTLLFSPTKAGYTNLLREGFKEYSDKIANADHPKIYHCGDVMYDNSLYFAELSEQKTRVLADLKLERNNYILATIHRNNNTDEPLRLTAIFEAFVEITAQLNITLVLPIHPRTSKLLKQNLRPDVYAKISANERIKLVPPVSFLEMTALEKNAKLIVTDSGGVQKEAFFFKKPCVILRAETEWVELVECGAAQLADTDHAKIIASINKYYVKSDLSFPPLFGDGQAAEFICKELLQLFESTPKKIVA